MCYRHPDRSTLLSCSHCGRPICSACSTDASVGQRCGLHETEGTQRVIPTGPRSSQSMSSGAFATMTFIAVAVVFFLLDALGIVEDLVPRFAQINALIADGEWWRIFSVVLLHGSITHIIFNMWALWVLGPQIERGWHVALCQPLPGWPVSAGSSPTTWGISATSVSAPRGRSSGSSASG